MTSQVSVEEESSPGALPVWRDPEFAPWERADPPVSVITHSGDPAATVRLPPTGAEREVGPGRRLASPIRVVRPQSPAPSHPGRRP